jgi:hypothetical protein
MKEQEKGGEVSNSEFDRDEFDRDDELRALLRGGDPASALSPADPAALAHLLEDIMSADLELRPAQPDAGDDGSRATGTHGRNRLTWLVAAAAAAMIASVGGFAIAGLSGGGGPQASDHPSTTSDGNAGLAGQTTALMVAEQHGRCAYPTPEILAQYPQAFAGTVTAIEGDTVTLETTEVYQGEVGETVQVTAPTAAFNTMMSVVDFQVGGSYVVAAFDGQMSSCYSGAATDFRPSYEKAFVN